jgi:hypothetical protein
MSDISKTICKPYGEWVVTAEFGRCFRPRGIEVGWRPYTNGRWCYTDDGWLWASDEPYGWATYHYGRWYEDSRAGWVWVPGRTWRRRGWRGGHGGGNVGWAPLPPHRRGTSININVEINRIEPRHYAFVEERYVAEPRIRERVRPVQQNVTIINNTTNITNITTVNNKVVNRGVDPAEVERAAGKKVQRVKVVETQAKGPAKQVGTEVAVFKPNIPPKEENPQGAGSDRRECAGGAAVRGKKTAPVDPAKKPAEAATPKIAPSDDSRSRDVAADAKTPKSTKPADTEEQARSDARAKRDERAKIDDAARGKTVDAKPDAPARKPDPRVKVDASGEDVHVKIDPTAKTVDAKPEAPARKPDPRVRLMLR